MWILTCKVATYQTMLINLQSFDLTSHFSNRKKMLQGVRCKSLMHYKIYSKLCNMVIQLVCFLPSVICSSHIVLHSRDNRSSKRTHFCPLAQSNNGNTFCFVLLLKAIYSSTTNSQLNFSLLFITGPHQQMAENGMVPWSLIKRWTKFIMKLLMQKMQIHRKNVEKPLSQAEHTVLVYLLEQFGCFSNITPV